MTTTYQDTLVDTGVPGTAAAHITRTPSATGVEQELTVVWSTRPMWCDPLRVDHATVEVPADRVPLVWDETGTGSWSVDTTEQCGCGRTLLVPAEVRRGYLTGERLAAVAQEVAAEAWWRRFETLQRVTAHLRGLLQEAMAEGQPGGVPSDRYGVDRDPVDGWFAWAHITPDGTLILWADGRTELVW